MKSKEEIWNMNLACKWHRHCLNQSFLKIWTAIIDQILKWTSKKIIMLSEKNSNSLKIRITLNQDLSKEWETNYSDKKMKVYKLTNFSKIRELLWTVLQTIATPTTKSLTCWSRGISRETLCWKRLAWDSNKT